MKLFANTGVAAWMWQRISAIILLAYIIVVSWCVGVPLLQGEALGYETWQMLFSGGMRLFGIVALCCLLLHAWLGMWIVATDYIPAAFRRIFLFILAAYLIFLFVWFVLATG